MIVKNSMNVKLNFKIVLKKPIKYYSFVFCNIM